MKKKKFGIIGCGAIGSRIAHYIHKSLRGRAIIKSLCDIDYSRPSNLISKLKLPATIDNIDTLIKKSDFIIEAASAKISYLVTKKSVACGKDILVMSAAGLLNKYDIFSIARRNNCQIYLPSGAICGLDGLKAASMGKVKNIRLFTHKPAKSLQDIQCLQRNKRFHSLKKKMVVFKGTASLAVKRFPKNINVSAILSLVVLNPHKVNVTIIADPAIKKNIHKIIINSDSGKIITETHNLPCPDNPKTSYLAVQSALATLKNVFFPLRIGT